ncbi:MAG: hypothetical protein WBG41_08360 [Acidimicrobiales bacterium]
MDRAGVDSCPSDRAYSVNPGLDTTRLDARAIHHSGGSNPGVDTTGNASRARRPDDDSTDAVPFGFGAVVCSCRSVN